MLCVRRPHTPWRSPRSSTAASTLNALGLRRGFKQLSIRLPAARTNLTAADDDVKFVGHAAYLQQAQVCGSTPAPTLKLRRSEQDRLHTKHTTRSSQQQRQQQPQQQPQRVAVASLLPPTLPVPADNQQHLPPPPPQPWQWQQHVKAPAGWLGAAWPQPAWQQGGGSGWPLLQHSLTTNDGGWLPNKLPQQMGCWAQVSGVGPVQIAALTAC